MVAIKQLPLSCFFLFHQAKYLHKRNGLRDYLEHVMLPPSFETTGDESDDVALEKLKTATVLNVRRSTFENSVAVIFQSVGNSDPDLHKLEALKKLVPFMDKLSSTSWWGECALLHSQVRHLRACVDVISAIIDGQPLPDGFQTDDELNVLHTYITGPECTFASSMENTPVGTYVTDNLANHIESMMKVKMMNDKINALKALLPHLVTYQPAELVKDGELVLPNAKHWTDSATVVAFLESNCEKEWLDGQAETLSSYKAASGSLGNSLAKACLRLFAKSVGSTLHQALHLGNADRAVPLDIITKALAHPIVPAKNFLQKALGKAMHYQLATGFVADPWPTYTGPTIMIPVSFQK